MWTIPGGRLETHDYINLPKDTKEYWYNVLEQTLAREVREEVGLKINNVSYLTSLTTIHKDGNPSIVISCLADYVSGKVNLQKEEADKYAWVNLKEAREYELIDGIYDELAMAEQKKQDKNVKWKRSCRGAGNEPSLPAGGSSLPSYPSLISFGRGRGN